MWRSEDSLQGVGFSFHWEIWRFNSSWHFTGARPCHSDISACGRKSTGGTQRPRLTLRVFLWTPGAVSNPNLPRLVPSHVYQVARGAHFSGALRAICLSSPTLPTPQFVICWESSQSPCLLMCLWFLFLWLCVRGTHHQPLAWEMASSGFSSS